MCFYFVFFSLKAKMKIKMHFQTNETKPSGYLKWFSIHHKILKFGLKYRNVESWQVFFDILFFNSHYMWWCLSCAIHRNNRINSMVALKDASHLSILKLSTRSCVDIPFPRGVGQRLAFQIFEPLSGKWTSESSLSFVINLEESGTRSLFFHIHVYIYIYIYTCIYTYVYIYTYI